MMAISTCTYPGCTGKKHARGYCNGHYQRLRQGKLLGALQQYVPASADPIEVFRKYAVESDGCWEWSGGLSSEGYARFSAGGHDHYGHRMSYEMRHGAIPNGLFVDHKCHNRACTNLDHLQAVTNKQNIENRSGAQRNSASRVRGVFFHENGKPYARVKHNQITHNLGTFETVKDAESAVIAKRNELFTNNLLDRAVQ